MDYYLDYFNLIIRGWKQINKNINSYKEASRKRKSFFMDINNFKWHEQPTQTKKEHVLRQVAIFFFYLTLINKYNPLTRMMYSWYSRRQLFN